MIENTAGRDPMLHLLGALGGMDGFIEGMEKQGQQQLVHSDRLPTEVHGGTDEDFIALGFSFGAPDAGDAMFRPATLPEGWKREGSEHSMWSYVVDANGRKRVEIFYKAAFYDRSAFMRLSTPYADLSRLLWGEAKTLPVDDWTPRELWVELLDKERERLLVEATERAPYYPEGAQKSREQAAVCSEYLAKLQEEKRASAIEQILRNSAAGGGQS